LYFKYKILQQIPVLQNDTVIGQLSFSVVSLGASFSGEEENSTLMRKKRIKTSQSCITTFCCLQFCQPLLVTAYCDSSDTGCWR